MSRVMTRPVNIYVRGVFWKDAIVSETAATVRVDIQKHPSIIRASVDFEGLGGTTIQVPIVDGNANIDDDAIVIFSPVTLIVVPGMTITS